MSEDKPIVVRDYRDTPEKLEINAEMEAELKQRAEWKQKTYQSLVGIAVGESGAQLADDLTALFLETPEGETVLEAVARDDNAAMYFGKRLGAYAQPWQNPESSYKLWERMSREHPGAMTAFAVIMKDKGV